MFCFQTKKFIITFVVCVIRFLQSWDHQYSQSSSKYKSLTLNEIELAKGNVRTMFYFAYDNYMRYAYPKDELDPINCDGRGHDHSNPSNLNINDVLGDYSLTLIESLDTLVVFGNISEFHSAVKRVIENVSFERNVTVQVFEANIRILGSLLSAHLILTDNSKIFNGYQLHGYNDELLTLAHDLAGRLLCAFDGTNTGLPYPRVNLMSGVGINEVNETCTAGAGSLLIEFGILSRLLDDPTYEELVRRVNRNLWSLRHKETGLLGNVVNIQTGNWRGVTNGLGAGLDSFYEYLLKAFILFGNGEDYEYFTESWKVIMSQLRRGRIDCVRGSGEAPIFVNIDMRDGSMINTWIDALQASFPSLLVLNGDVNDAVCLHAVYYALWMKYGAIPERFNWEPDVFFYSLRPEFVESTYMLYRATKNPFYLRVGVDIIQSLNDFTKVKCGYATIHNVIDKTLENRMESFFIAETVKYLYLLFDLENIVNINEAQILFTTEGHIIPISERLQQRKSNEGFAFHNRSSCQHARINRNLPPLDKFRFDQIFDLAGFS